jgi:uncharacterized membrane protein
MAEVKKHRLEATALKVTRWVGSPQSIVVHSLAFMASFAAVAFQVLTFDRMLLILTTVVSLEAIYLAIFIQMSLNVASATIEEVQEDVEEMQEDVEEIQEDIDEMQEDVEEIQENVDELQEDVEELNEEEVSEEDTDAKQQKTLEQIQQGLQQLMKDVEKLQNKP